MCLAIPSKIIAIDDTLGTIDVAGAKREVSLMLVENPQVGEYVLVHAGFAIQKIDEALALESMALMRKTVLAAESGDDRLELDG
jgi:hydrogenase expression/formation protein HypC